MDATHFPAAVAFGRQLVESGDLDPVYIAIAGADLPLRQRKRLVLAYACLYNLPLAGAMSEQAGDSFWKMLFNAAANVGGIYPRGTERRHWRGDAALASASDLAGANILPETIVNRWFGWEVAGMKQRPTFREVSRSVQQCVGFGPWIAFKVADLGERVLEVPVDFSDCAFGVFKDPSQGANLIATGNWVHEAHPDDVAHAMNQLIGELDDLRPRPGTRRFNVQEAETVLCKYKSHVKGHYPIGKDSREVAHALEHTKFPSKTGTKLMTALKRGIDWEMFA